ncbi:hypothetical protein HYALB_00001572 [Hymenoscyphus albidus]|uniref:Uncharacterized protein n=1 Tax=Hymenoscyphus albidus TaxID=595503 RepID=A0A9N9PWM1_9HELO|nr:hypothetical protein HYALB_00001572 [Hymenoscyphus albidus]
MNSKLPTISNLLNYKGKARQEPVPQPRALVQNTRRQPTGGTYASSSNAYSTPPDIGKGKKRARSPTPQPTRPAKKRRTKDDISSIRDRFNREAIKPMISDLVRRARTRIHQLEVEMFYYNPVFNATDNKYYFTAFLPLKLYEHMFEKADEDAGKEKCQYVQVGERLGGGWYRTYEFTRPQEPLAERDDAALAAALTMAINAKHLNTIDPSLGSWAPIGELALQDYDGVIREVGACDFF